MASGDRRIGNLFVSLSARTGAFAKGLNEARGHVAKFAKSVSVVGAAFAAVGGLGIGAIVKATSDGIDSLAKMGRQVGLTAGQMATYELAAGRAGTTTQVVLKAMQKLAQQQEKSLSSGKLSIEAFEKLGISLRDLRETGSVDRLLERIGVSLARVRSEGKRAALAMELFGEEGAALLNAFDKENSVFGQARIDAERFGLAVSKQASDALEAFNDLFADFGQIAKGFWRQYTAGLSEALKNSAQQFRDFILRFVDSAGGMQAVGKLLADATIQAFQVMAARVGDAIEFVRGGVRALLENVDAAAETMRGLAEQVQAFWDVVSLPARAVGRAAGFVSDLAGAARDLVDPQLPALVRQPSGTLEGTFRPLQEAIDAQRAEQQTSAARAEDLQVQQVSLLQAIANQARGLA